MSSEYFSGYQAARDTFDGEKEGGGPIYRQLDGSPCTGSVSELRHVALQAIRQHFHGR
jgi:hypothetical protein